MQTQGFTLIELLIALGVMALFAVLVYRGLDSILRMNERAQTQEQRSQAISRTLTQLEFDLQQALRVAHVRGATGSALVNVLEIERRGIVAGTQGKLNTVRWAQLGNTLTRSVDGEPPLVLLDGVARVDWLRAVDNLSFVSWAVIAAPAQPSGGDTASSPRYPVTRAAGIRLSLEPSGVVEKYFLIGR